jgi:hypothetical protein
MGDSDAKWESTTKNLECGKASEISERQVTAECRHPCESLLQNRWAGLGRDCLGVPSLDETGFGYQSSHREREEMVQGAGPGAIGDRHMRRRDQVGSDADPNNWIHEATPIGVVDAHIGLLEGAIAGNPDGPVLRVLSDLN